MAHNKHFPWANPKNRSPRGRFPVLRLKQTGGDGQVVCCPKQSQVELCNSDSGTLSSSAISSNLDPAAVKNKRDEGQAS